MPIYILDLQFGVISGLPGSRFVQHRTSVFGTKYANGQTIKGLMGPKIGLGGVAYRWIENFSKVFMLLFQEKEHNRSESSTFLKKDSHLCFRVLGALTNDACACKFLNVNLERTMIGRQDIYLRVENHSIKFQFFKFIY